MSSYIIFCHIISPLGLFVRYFPNGDSTDNRNVESVLYIIFCADSVIKERNYQKDTESTHNSDNESKESVGGATYGRDLRFSAPAQKLNAVLTLYRSVDSGTCFFFNNADYRLGGIFVSTVDGNRKYRRFLFYPFR